jgi:hypothetical protein
MSNIIELNSTFYHQKLGILQGSILSSLLCCLYLAHVEKEVILPQIQAESSLHVMIRQIDDYLFICDDVLVAKRFVEILSAGIQQYNIYSNVSKMKSNFLTEEDSKLEKMSWCGYSIDVSSLDLHVDFSRYADSNIRDFLRVQLSNHPGQALADRLKFLILPKTTCAFLDVSLNSVETVLSNIFSIFLVGGLKLLVHLSSLPDFPGERFISRLLDRMFWEFWKIKNSRFGAQPAALFDFTVSHCRWTAYRAYVQAIDLWRTNRALNCFHSRASFLKSLSILNLVRDHCWMKLSKTFPMNYLFNDEALNAMLISASVQSTINLFSK